MSNPARSNPRTSVLAILQPIEREVGRCQKCRLALTRKNVVFGRGNPLADLVILGEGPGEDEDNSGQPFVGRAGILLGRALEAIGRDEKNTYFLNTVKCRAFDPQESGWKKNRAPYEDELAACRDHTRRQLAALPNKRLIFALGSTAAHWLLQADPATLRIGSLRQKFLNIGLGLVPGLVTFHPSYLLRKENAEEKARVYEDFKLAKKLLDGQVDLDTVKLWSKSEFTDTDWRDLDRPPGKPLPKPDQQPGKPLATQADRYTSVIWIGGDKGETAVKESLPAALKPAFGKKAPPPKKKESPALTLFGEAEDDIPF
jgi:DNA polymerase